MKKLLCTLIQLIAVMQMAWAQDITVDNTTVTEATTLSEETLIYGENLYATDAWEGKGTKEEPYLIKSDMELAKLAHDVNTGKSLQMFSGVYFKLTQDIDLGGGIWTPIGTWDVNNSSSDRHFFAGKFDGDGHTISNMQINWTTGKNGEASWGLFSRLYGTGKEERQYATVTNLIIKDATLQKKDGNATSGTVKMGIVAGDLTNYAEVSNIIITGSKITDKEASYKISGNYRIGGVIGYLDNNQYYKIYNIASNTTVNILKNATGISSPTIAGGIGAVSKLNTANNAILPTNIFIYGPAVKTNDRCNQGGVVAFFPNNYKNFNVTHPNFDATWYYAEKVSTGNENENRYNCGTQKQMSDFGDEFAQKCNDYIKDNPDKKIWSKFSTADGGYVSFSSYNLKLERGTSDELKVENTKGEVAEGTCTWYVSDDNIIWTQQEANSTTFTLPRKKTTQYVKATLQIGNESVNTNTVTVSGIQIKAELERNGDPVTYTVKFTNNTEYTNEQLGLIASYEWKKGEEVLSTESSFARQNANDKYTCHFTVKSGELELFDTWFSTKIVVYLKPTDTDDTSENDRKASDSWGFDSSRPMKTWEGAYSKLNPNASWDDNVIVLMGISDKTVTRTGFCLTSNYKTTNSMLTDSNWDAVNSTWKGISTTLFRNVTITGQDEDGTNYDGTIEIYGAEQGLPIWGDTRFKNLTFANKYSEDHKGDYYKVIYCQYNNLEMGEGIVMKGFDKVLPGYATIDGANTAAFHIFGGIHNDGRFPLLHTSADIENFEKAMPHGKEGFKITIKSGYYACISVGGRNTSDGNYNGITGTPSMPVKCTIDVDIDREWNDDPNNNDGTMTKHYDMGCILAGAHEGAMIADVDIHVKSGKIGRIANGTLGNERTLTFKYDETDYYLPSNTYMGRANITLEPEKSVSNTSEDINGRIIVTELYGGSTGRCNNGDNSPTQNINNPFYGYSTITINGGTFKILPENNSKKNNILCGIFGAGAGGMNGIGNDTHYTPDANIPYWNADKNMIFYGDYNAAKSSLVTYQCYNAAKNDFTIVDPTKTNTQIVINGGVFEADVDGIFAGGSGYMSPGLWVYGNARPSTVGGNFYGEEGATVTSLTINGGEFYCTNGVFAGGRGTDYYYSKDFYGGNAGKYIALGQTYGNVELNINGGTFHCPVFGGGYGVADADSLQLDSNNKKVSSGKIHTLDQMARIFGKSTVNINGGTFYDNIYGGGDMAVIEYDGTGNATNVRISDRADIRGSVFAGGNGRAARPESNTTINNDTQSPELVGKVIGNTSLILNGTPEMAPDIYGDIFGGGNLAQVDGSTNVNIYAGNLAGEVYGGGKGLLNNGTVQNSANISKNTYVNLTQYTSEDESASLTLKPKLSINVIWNKKYNEKYNPDVEGSTEFFYWDGKDNSIAEFYDKKEKKFLNPHNIYGGGKDACKVAGTATVNMAMGMTPLDLLQTQAWKESYNENAHPHFYVFGGGYGTQTSVGYTDVTVNIDGDYSIFDSNVDDPVEPLAKGDKKRNAKTAAETEGEPVFDNSKGIPNFTVLGVLGGGYAGTVDHNTNVKVGGKTFLHRIYGGGFGIAESGTGNVGDSTFVHVYGGNIYGDVFGGGAGVSGHPDVARVIGTTNVTVSDEAKIYPNDDFGGVFGGGDIACVGNDFAADETPDSKKERYGSASTSYSELDQENGTFDYDDPTKYQHSNYKTFVNILGGSIFGNVYGGGKGVLKTTAEDYTKFGRVNGNTLVHIANSNKVTTYNLDEANSNVPAVWGTIYGGCAYGTVDGNALVHTEGGLFGNNIYGGGFGDVDVTTGDGTIYSKILGRKDPNPTSADILGNTDVRIDGGSWIWNRHADHNGNIIKWTDADQKIVKDSTEFKKLIRVLEDVKEKYGMKGVADTLKARNININPTFFEVENCIFRTKNCNIFGGGNRACNVKGNARVEINHSPLSTLTETVDGTMKKTFDMFDLTTQAGLCWYLCVNDIQQPQFSVFGAGFGATTTVGNTEVYAQPGAYVDPNGKDAITVAGKKFRYRNQRHDMESFAKFEDNLYNDYQNVLPVDKIKLYGSTDGTDSDPNTYLRYRTSRLAWALGNSDFTFMDIHGGGYSGYVLGKTKVVTDCQLACRNVFGGGLGWKPYKKSGEEYSRDDKGSYNGSNRDLGSVKDTVLVFVKAGYISQNVYGGGVGVPSVKNSEGSYIDFPDMARVYSNTNVNIYGERIKTKKSDKDILIDRTAIMGSVYGGGDVANVGSKTSDGKNFEAKPDTIDHKGYSKTKYVTIVNIRGGVILSHVFAGGKGLLASECANTDSLGSIFGNTCILTDCAYMSYPYRDTGTGKEYDPLDPMVMKPGESSFAFPFLMNRMYGGCQNGTVHGNTLVGINKGNFGSNFFGGGWGNVKDDESIPEEKRTTYADVTGNTNILINGGSVLLDSYWLPDMREWEPVTIFDDKNYSPQYNPVQKKFKINHNIYGGANLAGRIGKEIINKDGKPAVSGGNTFVNAIAGQLHTDTPVFTGQTARNFFESDEWHEVYEKIGSPHFSYFGGGYGAKAVVKNDTHVTIAMSNNTFGNEMDYKKEEAYKHYVSGYTALDIIGGGYEGKVEGASHVYANGIFCRRIIGGGFYSSVDSTCVRIARIDCDEVFGGGVMGDVIKNTRVQIGTKEDNVLPPDFMSPDDIPDATKGGNINHQIFIHGNVYGGNDVAGYVNVNDDNDTFTENGGKGTQLIIYGGRIYGNVYGAGNGDYLYALDKKGNTKVTVNEHFKLNENDENSQEFGLVYSVPMRDNMISPLSGNNAQKLVNINSWRPLTNKVNITIEGKGDTQRQVEGNTVTLNDQVTIDGDVYGGGNSATVLRVNATPETARANEYEGAVKINIGSHVSIGRVFMGCNGDALFENTGSNAFMTDFRKLNGNNGQELNLGDTIDWNEVGNKDISTLYLPTKNEQRPLVYPHLLDLYFQPIEMDIQGELLWNGTREGNGLTDCTIGSFCCGGNRGNMNVYPSTASDREGNVVDYVFPEGLTITGRIVGGCNNANYELKNGGTSIFHEGGYLLGLAKSNYPFIKLTIKNKFQPKMVDANGVEVVANSAATTGSQEAHAYVGGCVYGGCFETGTVRGDVTIDLRSDMLEGKSKTLLANSNELLASDPAYSALNVYGAGYGMQSYLYGNPHVIMGDGVSCSAPIINADGTFAPNGVGDNKLGVSANFIYGGGQQGNVIGVTNVEIKNGHVFRSVTGGSYSGFVWGSTQVKVGYPKYYTVRPYKSGRYDLNRTDKENKDIDKGMTVARETIKQTIHLVAGDVITQAVYDAICSKYDNIRNTDTPISADNKSEYFMEVSDATPLVGWDNVNIYIDEAVYGGGYSLAQGSSVLANNTTVLKFTPEYNLDDAFTTDQEHKDELQTLPGRTTAGFGGNTTILVADNTAADSKKDHITISSQQMKEAKLAEGQDLLGYYYKDNKGLYHYIYKAGLYYKGGSIEAGTLPTEMDGSTIYTYDNEGGIFGDGHLSYAQGFRSAELSGYGFAEHTVVNPKIINTFQRLDILRLANNCFSLLGARDYATNAMDMTPYSISRVGEIQMVSDGVANGELASTSSKRARNYMGFANNIHYVGALSSDVSFDTAKWHDDKGKEATDAKETYKAVKQKYITYKDNNDSEFEKRNDGTAKNMIGIASGYALKIQNAQHIGTPDNITEERLYYGPIYGVVEMNLIDVREDEGGGYVYADNVHGDEDNGFLETTGNFLFPYSSERHQYIVDDCFPRAFASGAELPEAHYWYVTGFNYHYNAHITGFTFKRTGDYTSTFDSDNKDGIVALSGVKGSQEVDIVSWKMYSAHDGDDYSCDLEDRNYKDNTDRNVKGKYSLHVGAANKNVYVDPSDSENDSGFSAELFMRNGEDNSSVQKKTLPSSLTNGDAKIVFQLKDKADNSGADYYKNHLSQPCKGTLVLKAEAQNENGKQIENHVAISKVYTKNADGTYTKVNNNLSADETYYYRNGETDFYQEITQFYEKREKTDGKYDTVKVDKSQVDLSSANIYYCLLPRFYTFTIDLTIDYIQGPDIDGHIDVENCALPGEMIKLSKKNVHILADASLSANGYYWRIGKRQKTTDGAWEFVDGTTWAKNTTAPGYDTFCSSAQNEVGKGLFTDCVYNKTEDYLLVPAYYFMNGYGVQLGITFNSTHFNDEIFPVEMRNEDQLVVHNYHQMDPHGDKVNLHLAEAVARAKAETNFAQPRIYIYDTKDIAAFKLFIDTIGTGNTNAEDKEIIKFMEKDTDGKWSLTDCEVPIYGKYAQFVLQNNIDLTSHAGLSNASPCNDFKGIFHGNGNIISGLDKGKSLFKALSGDIYNLGLASGSMVSSDLVAGAKVAGLHCCFEYKPATQCEGVSTPLVYSLDGTIVTTYKEEDFKYGRVAYDLNGYYLRARQSHTTEADKQALKYVRDYFQNGDYQYAKRSDEDTKNHTGITYLRTSSYETPNYGSNETRHKHAIDRPRVESYTADNQPIYAPLFNEMCHIEGHVTSADSTMNDYMFWGQSLQNEPAPYPSQLVSRQLSYMTNRVYRTAGYYGTTTRSTFHYNAHNRNGNLMDTYVHDPAITAIDFTCDDDNATFFNRFFTKQDVTRNLLVYTPANDNHKENEAYDAVHVSSYEKDTDEKNIYLHHVSKSATSEGSYEAKYLHLVERTEESEPNNDFCVPIPFTVTDRAWYTRRPKYYSNSGNDAWEGICLPFTVKKAVASLNGEITHFYGTAPEGTAPEANHWNLHHEYWLRGLVSCDQVAGTSGSTPEAHFQRPGKSEGLFDPKPTDGTTQCEGVSYTFANAFFKDTYGRLSYNATANTHYDGREHMWTDYLPQLSSVPYIVSFPGKRFYEFDLSSEFYNSRLNKQEPRQTITFDASPNVVIPVTQAMQTEAKQTDTKQPEAKQSDAKQTAGTPRPGRGAEEAPAYHHVGTFAHKEPKEGSIYGIDEKGVSFRDDAASIMPFRTYMEKKPQTEAGAKAKALSPAPSVILIAQTRAIDKIEPEGSGAQTDQQPDGNYLVVRPAGKQRIAIESTYATNLRVFTPSGQLYRILDIRPGTATYSGFHSGLYIVGKLKVRVE